MGHTLCYGRVDSVLADIPLDSEIVRARAFVFGEIASLLLVLVRRVPGAQDDLAAAAHGLRVRGHHADGAEIVQDVFGGDGFGTDADFPRKPRLRGCSLTGGGRPSACPGARPVC